MDGSARAAPRRSLVAVVGDRSGGVDAPNWSAAVLADPRGPGSPDASRSPATSTRSLTTSRRPTIPTTTGVPRARSQGSTPTSSCATRAGGGWDKERDGFPYDSPDVCVAVYPSEDGYDDVLSPLAAIDVYGILPMRSESDTVFCRSGDTWERQPRPGEDPPPAPDCMTVARWVFTPPRTIDPPDTPEPIGRQRQVVVDERFTTTYCLRDGVWRLTADNFPYSSPDECVAVHYDLDEHDRTPPPDTIFPIGEIDELGHIDNAGGAGGTANLETYCRDGDVWKRTARADDMPSGSYTSWAESARPST